MLNTSLLEVKLGFDQVRSQLASHCLGAPGRELISAIGFMQDYDLILQELSVADEFRTMMITMPGFPAEEYADLRPELISIRIPGSYLDVESMLLLKYSYFFFAESILFIRKLDVSQFPHLISIIDGFYPDERIISEINRIIDEKGEIKDNASSELSKIRKDISSQLKQVDKKIAVMLNQAKTQKWVGSDVEIAVRNGRLVIPVPATNKRKINGVIHDESASGQTVYLEPTEVFELNNGIRELELAEKREIIRILTQFADFLRPRLEELIHSYELLGKIDFIRAKTLFALEIGASKPLLSNRPSFSWREARHPLLYLSHQRQNKTVVPLDIHLEEENRILIISGPNAGGKSVCLKTVGLLQYMLQCGLLVPMRETSETGVFSSVFIDIGDQQSIEDDLSTYSSHLVNIKKLLEQANPTTLFLIDEFGSGTEPQSGGAIAEAVLEALNEKKAFGVVTTHYANLKLLAGKGNGFINGAMLFDTRLMRPLFQLKIGKPGSSFAFEIAGNIKFPESVLKHAGEKLGHAQLDFDKQIQELESERSEILLKEKQLHQADEMLNGILSKYKQLIEELETGKKDILEKARSEARNMLEKSNKIIEKTVREIRQSQADKDKTRELRDELKEFSAQIENVTSPKIEIPQALAPESLVTKKIHPDQFRIGDQVTMEGQHEAGELVEITMHDALVAFRTVKLRVKLEKLELVTQQRKPVQAKKSLAYNNMVNDLNARIANFRLKIDVRGYRAEEALNMIQKYIDESIMLHVPEVSILHGKGNGILRQTIRQYLQGVPEVKGFADETLEMGGSGITLVRFRY
ncbi:MAG: Smr/MutS family protein [Bacteroidales bacterium]|nr:Smr/MutS family protein [Bacteroidales bacterium]